MNNRNIKIPSELSSNYFQRGTVTLFLARPANGRNSFLIELSNYLSQNESVVALLNDENHYFLNSHHLLYSDSSRLTTTKSNPLTIPELRQKIISMQQEKEFHILIIDEMSLLLSRNRKSIKTKTVFRITFNDLEEIAREFNIAIITGLVPHRNIELRENKRPTFDDIESLGEEYLYNIFGLYRDVIYNMDSEKPGILEVIPLKLLNKPVQKITYETPFVLT